MIVTLITGFGQGELNELADVAENCEVNKELYRKVVKKLHIQRNTTKIGLVKNPCNSALNVC